MATINGYMFKGLLPPGSLRRGAR